MMGHVFFLAWRYVRHNAGKSTVLVLAIALTVLLPVTSRLLMARYERAMRARARETPLLIGPAGHRFDLLLHALYFRAAHPDTLPWSEVDRIADSGYGVAVPLHARFTASGHPVVGTTPEYYTHRGLAVREGTLPLLIGDCVLGSAAARALDLKAGARLMTDPENVFDLAGSYPLNMRVTGVLRESRGPDDWAVFTDIKSAWIIEGLGHGHQDVVRTAPPEVILKRSGENVAANEALVKYTEITDENIGSFHFHGDPATFPVTGILVWPRDEKSGTLLRGLYVGKKERAEALVPVAVIDELLEAVFRFQRYLNAHAVMVGAATLLFIALVLLLSFRLRRAEREIMHRIGCSRWTVAWLHVAELLIVLAFALLLTALCTAAALHFSSDILRWLLH
jgi:putative ABC transport system permease protein